METSPTLSASLTSESPPNPSPVFHRLPSIGRGRMLATLWAGLPRLLSPVSSFPVRAPSPVDLSCLFPLDPGYLGDDESSPIPCRGIYTTRVTEAGVDELVFLPLNSIWDIIPLSCRPPVDSSCAIRRLYAFRYWQGAQATHALELSGNSPPPPSLSRVSMIATTGSPGLPPLSTGLSPHEPEDPYGVPRGGGCVRTPSPVWSSPSNSISLPSSPLSPSTREPEADWTCEDL